MPTWLSITLRDMLESVSDLGIQLFILPTSLMLWAFVLLFPLKRVDRRDKITGMTYVLCSVSAGVALMYVLPQPFIPDESASLFVVTSLVAGAATIRWIFGKHRQKGSQELVLDGEVKKGTKGRKEAA